MSYVPLYAKEKVISVGFCVATEKDKIYIMYV